VDQHFDSGCASNFATENCVFSLVLCIGPPALALGIEPTAKDAMNKPPSEYQNMFTLRWFIDLYVSPSLSGF
jgi:magnesium-transporting ATPase (P-type)